MQDQRPESESIAVKSTAVSYLLWVVGGFGVLGLHRFYLGRWITGILWVFTGGFFFIGALIDLFLIPSMTRVENLASQLMASERNRLEGFAATA